jgi:hypothetical protein
LESVGAIRTSAKEITLWYKSIFLLYICWSLFFRLVKRFYGFNGEHAILNGLYIIFSFMFTVYYLYRNCNLACMCNTRQYCAQTLGYTKL